MVVAMLVERSFDWRDEVVEWESRSVGSCTS